MSSPSAGSQDPRWQRFIPKPVILCKTLGSSGTGLDTGIVEFRVPFPDSRLRVKISLIFNNTIGNFAAGTSPNCPPTTLWLYEEDELSDGQQGDDMALTNIVGTSAAPLVIPTDNALVPALDPALNGYSREFVSAADYIKGRMVVTNTNGAAGWWILQTRYQPQSVSFSPEEWKLITAHCSPNAPGAITIA